MTYARPVRTSRTFSPGMNIDVYALGLVLLEAITGRREYPGTPAEAAHARLHRPPEIPELPDAEPDWAGAAALLGEWGLNAASKRFRERAGQT